MKSFFGILLLIFTVNAKAATFLPISDYITQKKTATDTDRNNMLLQILKAQNNLKDSFDSVCGDSFCEGDYILYSVELNCSVDSETGKVGTCDWVFFGTDKGGDVSPKDGSISDYTGKNFNCRFQPKMTAEEMLKTLSDPTADTDYLDMKLGMDKSIYDSLTTCLP